MLQLGKITGLSNFLELLISIKSQDLFVNKNDIIGWLRATYIITSATE